MRNLVLSVIVCVLGLTTTTKAQAPIPGSGVALAPLATVTTNFTHAVYFAESDGGTGYLWPQSPKAYAESREAACSYMNIYYKTRVQVLCGTMATLNAYCICPVDHHPDEGTPNPQVPLCGSRVWLVPSGVPTGACQTTCPAPSVCVIQQPCERRRLFPLFRRCR
jgi:hypothetical protein